jgi:hypothetical protein
MIADGTLTPLAFEPETEDAPDYSGRKYYYSLSNLIYSDHNIRDGHSAVWNNFYNLEPWIFSVMLWEIYSQLQFPLTK